LEGIGRSLVSAEDLRDLLIACAQVSEIIFRLVFAAILAPRGTGPVPRGIR
jgi:hypothetical protein